MFPALQVEGSYSPRSERPKPFANTDRCRPTRVRMVEGISFSSLSWRRKAGAPDVAAADDLAGRVGRAPGWKGPTDQGGVAGMPVPVSPSLLDKRRISCFDDRGERTSYSWAGKACSCGKRSPTRALGRAHRQSTHDLLRCRIAFKNVRPQHRSMATERAADVLNVHHDLIPVTSYIRGIYESLSRRLSQGSCDEVA